MRAPWLIEDQYASMAIAAIGLGLLTIWVAMGWWKWGTRKKNKKEQ